MKIHWLAAIFLFTFTVLAINRYTPLYINNDAVHYLLLVTACFTLVLLAGHAVNRIKQKKSRLLAFLAVALICFGKAFLTWGGEWKTQTILYKSANSGRKTIEYQMRGDRFSFGYRKRVVGRLRIVPSIDWITDIDSTAIDTTRWRRIDETVNALGLKNYQSYGRQ